MNMRKLSINKACVLWGTLLLLAVGAVCAAVYLLTQNITAVRVCVPVQSLCTALRYLLCGPDPPEAGSVLRCLLWSDG